MNRHIVLVTFFTLLLSASFIGADNLTVRLYQVDPLKKVLKEASYFRDEIDTVRIAKGETGSLQIVVKGLTNFECATVESASVIINNGLRLHYWIVWCDRSCYPHHIKLSVGKCHYFPDPFTDVF